MLKIAGDVLPLLTVAMLKDELKGEREKILPKFCISCKVTSKNYYYNPGKIALLSAFLASLFTFSYLMTILSPVLFNSILQTK